MTLLTQFICNQVVRVRLKKESRRCNQIACFAEQQSKPQNQPVYYHLSQRKVNPNSREAGTIQCLVFLLEK